VVEKGLIIFIIQSEMFLLSPGARVAELAGGWNYNPAAINELQIKA
jgi:hypothetical protein